MGYCTSSSNLGLASVDEYQYQLLRTNENEEKNWSTHLTMLRPRLEFGVTLTYLARVSSFNSNQYFTIIVPMMTYDHLVEEEKVC